MPLKKTKILFSNIPLDTREVIFIGIDFEKCMENAMKLFNQAIEVHEKARNEHPDVSKYIEATKLFESAAEKFGSCYKVAQLDYERRLAEAWYYYAISRAYGDKAAAEYFTPIKVITGKIHPIRNYEKIEDHLSKAIKNCEKAIDLFPPGESQKLKEQWEVLKFSYKAFYHRIRAEKLYSQDKYDRAADEYKNSSEYHFKAYEILKKIEDIESANRVLGRYHTALRDYYFCLALSINEKYEEYLKKSIEEAEIAGRLRPRWESWKEIKAHMEKELYLRKALKDLKSENDRLINEVNKLQDEINKLQNEIKRSRLKYMLLGGFTGFLIDRVLGSIISLLIDYIKLAF